MISHLSLLCKHFFNLNRKNTDPKADVGKDLNKMKELTKSFTDKILKEYKGKGNLMMKTNLLSIQMSSSDPKEKKKAEAEAIKNKLSLIDFSTCEKFLKENGLIPPNESISYSKTDWNSKLDYPPSDNAGMQKGASVSYDLFAANGTKINRSLCKDTTTDIKIPLKNIDQLNLKLVDQVAKKGFNIFDTESPYFEDRCIPMTDEAETISDRRKQYPGKTLGCKGGCKMSGINSTLGYVNCVCNTTNSDAEVGTKFAKKLLGTLTDSNIEIVKCFNTVMVYVSLFINMLA